VKGIVPNLKKIHYFSDGSAAQYKNKFNFVNVSFHDEDFGVQCDWNFFATSHGKNSCDGVGGTLKRVAASASLSRTHSDHILTAEKLCKVLQDKGNLHTECCFVAKEEVSRTRHELGDRLSMAKTVKGTLKIHRVTPVKANIVVVRELAISEGREVMVA